MARTQFGCGGGGRGTGRNSAYVNPWIGHSVQQIGNYSNNRYTENFLPVEDNSNPQLDLPNQEDELSLGDSSIRSDGSVPPSIDTRTTVGTNIETTTSLPSTGARLMKFVIINGCTTTCKVKRSITRMFKNHFKSPILTWRDLKEDIQSSYWSKFKTIYEVHVDKVEAYRSIFNEVAAECYRSMMYEPRKESMIDVGTNSIVDCSNKPPTWMHDSIWKQLVVK